MNETREFPTEVVASITTGILLCDMAEVHECSDWIAGHAIWTHEFADAAFVVRLRESVFAEHPQLRSLELESFPSGDVEKHVSAVIEQFGTSLSLTKGTCSRTESPIDSMRRMYPDKEIVTITPD